MTEKQKSAAEALIINLRKQHPRESKKKLFERFEKIVEKDEALKQEIVESSFKMLCDELYDEHARKGGPIPKALRKPS